MAKLFKEETTDFSYGMVDGAAPTAMPKTAVSLLLNGRIMPDSTVETRSGSIKLHPTLLEDGTGFGGSEFVTAAGVEQMLVFFGAKAFVSDDQGATWTDVTGALVLREDYYDFAFMRVGATNYLFCANGDATVKRWDGATLTDAVAFPAGVKYIEPFNGRIYFSGHSGVLVQATKIADPTVIASPDGLTIQVIRPPTALFQLGQHLLVFDDDETSYIDGYGEQTIVVATGAQGFSRSVGCPFFRTIVGVGDSGACWLSKRGVEYYSVGSGITQISRNIPGFLLQIDWTQMAANPGLPTAVYDAIDQNYHLALSTNGARNNRVLVQNLLQNSQFQRSGPRSASAIDRILSPNADLLLSVDADGYLSAGSSGDDAEQDPDGYLRIAHTSGGGEALSEDADGYLESDTNETVPATLFIAPGNERPSTIHSLGYDGFVRRHSGDGVDADDMDSDGTGGTPVEMKVRARPFLGRQPKLRKRVRKIHVDSINDDEATLTVRVVDGAGASSERDVTMPAGSAGRGNDRMPGAMVKYTSRAPQVEVRTTDKVKLSYIGASSEFLKETV